MPPSLPLPTTLPLNSSQEFFRRPLTSSSRSRSAALALRRKVSWPRQKNPTAASSSVSTIASSKMSSISASLSLPANTAASSALTPSSPTARNPATKKVGRPTPSAVAVAAALIPASTSLLSSFGCSARPHSPPALSTPSSGQFKSKSTPPPPPP